MYVWGIVAGSSVGLLASTLGRLYSSTYYALRDTRTPLRFAVIRVALTTGLGYLCALPLPRLIGIEPRWGAVGLTASAGVAGWVEFTLLRRRLNRRIGQTDCLAVLVAKLWTSAAVAAAAVGPRTGAWRRTPRCVWRGDPGHLRRALPGGGLPARRGRMCRGVAAPHAKTVGYQRRQLSAAAPVRCMLRVRLAS